MEEQWRDIIITKDGVVYDYTGLYQVSNLGRVRSLNYKGTGTIHNLKPKKNNKGYLQVGLRINNNTQMFQVHRLVAIMFIPNPDNLPVVNHKDENPSNCHVDNLEWVTHKYNVNYGTSPQRRSEAQKGKVFSEEHKRKLRENHADMSGGKHPQAKKVVCVETGQVFDSIKEAKKWLGKGDIYACCKGRRKTAGGYHWEYAE